MESPQKFPLDRGDTCSIIGEQCSIQDEDKNFVVFTSTIENNTISVPCEDESVTFLTQPEEHLQSKVPLQGKNPGSGVGERRDKLGELPVEKACAEVEENNKAFDDSQRRDSGVEDTTVDIDVSENITDDDGDDADGDDDSSEEEDSEGEYNLREEGEEDQKEVGWTEGADARLKNSDSVDEGFASPNGPAPEGGHFPPLPELKAFSPELTSTPGYHGYQGYPESCLPETPVRHQNETSEDQGNRDLETQFGSFRIDTSITAVPNVAHPPEGHASYMNQEEHVPITFNHQDSEQEPMAAIGIQPTDSTLNSGILPSCSQRHHSPQLIDYGTPEQLIQKAMEFMLPQVQEGGIILEDKRFHLAIVNGCYAEPHQFRYVNRLGSGAQGECCAARDEITQFEFCIKKITGDYKAEEVIFMTRLLREDGFVQIYGAIKENNSVYILMQLLRGPSLTNWIKYAYLGDREDVVTRLRIFYQILERVRVLSTHGILHEDIKGDNIILTGLDRNENDPIPNFIDFGLAMNAPCQPNQPSLGTVTHFSPEKARSEGHSHGAEVYASTTCFVHSLMRKVPLQDITNVGKALYKIGFYGPPFDSLPQWLPGCLTMLIEHGWSDNPSDRGTAEQLQNEICEVIHGGLEDLDESQLDGAESEEESQPASVDSGSQQYSMTTLGINVREMHLSDEIEGVVTNGEMEDDYADDDEDGEDSDEDDEDDDDDSDDDEESGDDEVDE